MRCLGISESKSDRLEDNRYVPKNLLWDAVVLIDFPQLRDIGTTGSPILDSSIWKLGKVKILILGRVETPLRMKISLSIYPG